MRYYEWLGDVDAVDIGFPDLAWNGFWMVEGTPVPVWPDVMIGSYVRPDPPVFHFGLARNSWPVLSARMWVVMQRIAPGMIQFLPVRLQKARNRRKVHGYGVGQLLKRVDCLDRKRTRARDQWEPINSMGDFGVIRPWILSRSMIGDSTLFRITGACSRIVIREDLKQVIQRSDLGEQRFDPIECSE